MKYIFKIAQELSDWLGIPTDKLLHFVAGFSIALIGSILFGKETGFALAILAGIGKEIRDQIVYGGFDIMDLIVTIAGGLLIFLIY